MGRSGINPRVDPLTVNTALIVLSYFDDMSRYSHTSSHITHLLRCRSGLAYIAKGTVK